MSLYVANFIHKTVPDSSNVVPKSGMFFGPISLWLRTFTSLSVVKELGCRVLEQLLETIRDFNLVCCMALADIPFEWQFGCRSHYRNHHHLLCLICISAAIALSLTKRTEL